jgi:aquaporin Z
VNPARSLRPAIFDGGVAMQQVWLFILAPLVGALVTVVIWRLTRTSEEQQRDIVAGDER